MNANTAGEAVDLVDGCEIDLPGAQPVVRIREEHSISRRDIDPDALKVLYRLARNEYIAYLVGGGVRDLLLGRKPKDFDISTNARPEQIRSLFRNCILIGRRFRLAHIRYGEKIIETSTFRSTPKQCADPADPEADLFQRDDNLFGSPHEDALRRDFTVNGLFYDIDSFSIIDYVGGLEDLDARRIRCIGDPNIRFREDPIRMVRAVRFASRLDFTLDPETEQAIREHGEELTKASPARLLEEITRLFAFSAGEKAVRLLHATGLLKVILPEISACIESDTVDTENFWKRLRALDEGDTVLPGATPALIFSTLLLDSLKLHLERGWTHADSPKLRFDKVHSFLDPLGQRLRFPRKLVDRIVHMYITQHRFGNNGNKGKRGSLSNFVMQDAFHESLALAEIILTAEGGDQARLSHWRDLLTERIYGKEESGDRDRHGRPERRQPAAALVEKPASGEEGAGENEAAPAEPPGRKLSRSARRRRNKRMRRQEDTTHATMEKMESTAGEAAAEIVDVPATTNQAIAPASETSEQKEPRSRTRRGRGRQKAEEPQSDGKAAPEPAAEGEKNEQAATARKKPAARSGRPRPVPQPEPEKEDAEPPRPLTAAAFWTMPEPEPEPEPEKKKSRSRKKPAAKADKEKKAETEEPAQPKPLAMDKADEADIPMHWLDEI